MSNGSSIGSFKNLNNIPVDYANTPPTQKVKQKHIKSLEKNLKTVMNKYDNLLRGTSITGKFEVTYYNEGELKNISNNLIEIKNEAESNTATMHLPDYALKFNVNEKKLNQLKKIIVKINKLQSKIQKMLNDYNYQGIQSEKHWEEQNNPKKIAARQQQQAQRKLDRKNDVFNGGMVK